MVRTALGIDLLEERMGRRLRNRRLGLLSNQASLDRNLTPSKEVLCRVFPGRVKALFGPQHGHSGEEQDNMVETTHRRDPELNIPVFSLYSETREPNEEMFDLVDTLIIDLQDVGTRVYTFASTVLNCLKAAARFGKQILILDRPNPIGGEILEGAVLKPEFYSFVGAFRFPMRHGLTMAEMALIFDRAFSLDSDLQVVAMKGWKRKTLWPGTGLRWVMPSPNMPVFETSQVYPGQVIWEGTNISEGRGTCRPFEMFGAPFLDVGAIAALLPAEALAGCRLQQVTFRPTFHKWQGELCRGFMVHVTDPGTFRPYYFSIAVLRAVLLTHRDRFEWKQPPYEYEFERMPIDLILGDRSLREGIEKGYKMDEFQALWEVEIREFREWRESFLIYR
jgi:uncharacterized protein YbbC (DUF1343 family)